MIKSPGFIRQHLVFNHDGSSTIGTLACVPLCGDIKKYCGEHLLFCDYRSFSPHPRKDPATDRIRFRLIALRRAIVSIGNVWLAHQPRRINAATRMGMMKRPDHRSVRFVITRIGWQRTAGVLISRITEHESH